MNEPNVSNPQINEVDTGPVSMQLLLQLENRDIGFNYGFPPCNTLINLEHQIRLKGILLSFSRYFAITQKCPEQSRGIGPLKNAFGAGSDGTITKVPAELTLDTQDCIHILKIGPRETPPAAIIAAKEYGMSAVWDDENLIILAREEYEDLVEKIIDFLEPFKVRLQLDSYIGGNRLMIVRI